MFSSNDICEKLKMLSVEVVCHGEVRYANSLCSYRNVASGALVWYGGSSSIHFDGILPEIIFVSKKYPEIEKLATKMSVIVVDNPRLCFSFIANIFFEDQIKSAKGISDPKLFDSCDSKFIGRNSYIGSNVKIGKNTIIGPNCTIMPNVELGSNVTIGPGSVIGAPGFGYVEHNGGWIEFPQIGGVYIGDYSRIGANCCVDAGALNATTIGKNVIISNGCQIAHNAIIGDHVTIASRVIIGGSSKIENKAKIWQGAVLSKGINIGYGAEVMLGSVVVEDVEPMKRVSGNFAVSHGKNLLNFAKMRKK